MVFAVKLGDPLTVLIRLLYNYVKAPGSADLVSKTEIVKILTRKQSSPNCGMETGQRSNSGGFCTVFSSSEPIPLFSCH